MKNTLIALLLLVNLSALGQINQVIPNDSRLPNASYGKILDYDPAKPNQLRFKDASGNYSLLEVDSAKVNGLSTRIALMNQLINARTANFTKASLRVQFNTLATSAGSITIQDINQGGTFILDPTDTTTPDDSVMTLVTANGLRYKRYYEGAVNLKWFGAKGDGIANDSAAVQKAVDYVCKTVNPGLYSRAPRFTGQIGTLLVPVGTYKVANIRVHGSIRIRGEGGGTYAGAMFKQLRDHVNIFIITPDTDGVSNSCVLEGLYFVGGSASRDASVAQVNIQSGIASNSVYIFRCWFQEAENRAIKITQGNDIQIVLCTFDVSAYGSIELGTVGGGEATDVEIIGCKFYNIPQESVLVRNGRGIVLNANRMFNNEAVLGASTSSSFLSTLGASQASAITVSSTEYYNVGMFAYLDATTSKNIAITGTVSTRARQGFLYLSGGGTMTGLNAIGNSISFVAAPAVAPIYLGAGNAIQNSVTAMNSFSSTIASPLLIDASNANVTNNVLTPNTAVGFTTIHNLANPQSNGVIDPETLVRTTYFPASPSAVWQNLHTPVYNSTSGKLEPTSPSNFSSVVLGLQDMAKQSSANVNISGGVAKFSSTTATNSIVNSLTVGTTQSLGSLFMGDNANTPTNTPLTINMGGTYSNTPGGNLKLKLADVGGVLFGMGVSPNQMDFSVPNGSTYSYYVNGSKIFSAGASGLLTLGDIEITVIGKGVILKSPNGTRYRLTVSDAGVSVWTPL